MSVDEMSYEDEELLGADEDAGGEGLDPTEAKAEDGVSATAAPGSTIAHLRQLREEVADTHSKVFEIPGWHRCLGARLRFVPPEGFAQYGKRLGKGTDPLKNLRANIQLLIDACEEVVCRPDDNAEWAPVLDEPVVFEARLAQALEYPEEVDSARRVVIALFGGPEKAPWRINNLVANEFSDWLNGEDEGVSPELGEPSPSTGT